jgi:hypothetical protein
LAFIERPQDILQEQQRTFPFHEAIDAFWPACAWPVRTAQDEEGSAGFEAPPWVACSWPRRARLAAVLRRATMNYMSQPLSVRLNDATISRLGARARRVHLPPRTLAQRYVEEGLRMDEHPLIRFADGPAGRRARLLGTGKDVWEVIAVVRDNGGDAAESARYLEVPLGLVQAAIAYYGAYTTEIDQELEANEQETAEAHAAYLAGQAALRR